MKDHDANRHPGPWRVMSVDSETAGILVAVGFLAMGLVSIPVARWFVVGCLALGGAVAVLLRFTSRKFIRLIGRLTVGTLIILAAYALWPGGHIPRRPHTVWSNALYILPNNAQPGSFGTAKSPTLPERIKAQRALAQSSYPKLLFTGDPGPRLSAFTDKSFLAGSRIAGWSTPVLAITICEKIIPKPSAQPFTIG